MSLYNKGLRPHDLDPQDASGNGIEITDGTHDVTGAKKLTVTGGTVGGTTPNATLDINGVPVGGTTGQVLTKASNTDYDADWEAGGGGGGWTAALVNITSDNTQTTEVTLDLTVMAMRVGVTTDGSGLAQVVDIPNFALTNGENSAMNGYRVSVTCDVLTAGGDVPLVTINGGSNIMAAESTGLTVNFFANTTGSGPANSIPIDYTGATAILEWCNNGWYWADENFNNDAAVTKALSYVPAGGSTGQVLGKNSNTDGDTGWIAGASGTFLSADAKTITVVEGVITSIV